MMDTFFTILILVPTVAVLVLGVLLLLGTLATLIVASVDGLVVGLRHRMHPQQTHYGTPLLHH